MREPGRGRRNTLPLPLSVSCSFSTSLRPERRDVECDRHAHGDGYQDQFIHIDCLSSRFTVEARSVASVLVTAGSAARRRRHTGIRERKPPPGRPSEPRSGAILGRRWGLGHPKPGSSGGRGRGARGQQLQVVPAGMKILDPTLGSLGSLFCGRESERIGTWPRP